MAFCQTTTQNTCPDVIRLAPKRPSTALRLSRDVIALLPARRVAAALSTHAWRAASPQNGFLTTVAPLVIDLLRPHLGGHDLSALHAKSVAILIDAAVQDLAPPLSIELFKKRKLPDVG